MFKKSEVVSNPLPTDAPPVATVAPPAAPTAPLRDYSATELMSAMLRRFNAHQAFPAELSWRRRMTPTADVLREFARDSKTVDCDAAPEFQRGLGRQPSQLGGQASMLLAAALAEGLLFDPSPTGR